MDSTIQDGCLPGSPLVHWVDDIVEGRLVGVQEGVVDACEEERPKQYDKRELTVTAWQCQLVSTGDSSTPIRYNNTHTNFRHQSLKFYLKFAGHNQFSRQYIILGVNACVKRLDACQCKANIHILASGISQLQMNKDIVNQTPTF
jgi:hypothetical protein